MHKPPFAKTFFSEKCMACDLLGHSQPLDLIQWNNFHITSPIPTQTAFLIRHFNDVIKPELYAYINKGPPVDYMLK